MRTLLTAAFFAAASCVIAEREPPVSGPPGGGAFVVPPGTRVAYGSEVTTPVSEYLEWAATFEPGKTSASNQYLVEGLDRLRKALRALETTVPDLRDELARRLGRMELEAGRILAGGPTDQTRAAWVRDALTASLDVLEEIAHDRAAADPALADALRELRAAVDDIQPDEPLSDQLGALTTFFRATVATMASLANVVPPPAERRPGG